MRYFLGILLIVVMACTKLSSSQLEKAYDFYLNEEGYWIEYQVDSIYIDEDLGLRDTIRFYIKEEIGSTFQDNEGRSTQRIYRYKKDSINDEYVLEDVWSLNKLKRSVEKVEENLRFVKLSFPFEEQTTWKGNNYILTDYENAFYADWEYRYLDLYESITLNGLVIDSTVTVDQEDNLTDHFWYYGREVYAYQIGMVKKELYKLESNESLSSKEAWMKSAEEGFMLTYSLINYKQ